jgi:Putative adhesin
MMYRLQTAGVAALALVLSGCDWEEWGDSQRFKEDFQHSHALKPGGRISIENSNGSIEIIGWEKSTVEITGSKYASTEPAMKAMKIDIISEPDSLRIRTVVPSGHRGNYGARYVLRVPHQVELDRIVSSNGTIRLDSLEGSARVRTSNGTVRVLKLKGAAEIETSNGAVEVTDHSGPVIARTSNGAIRADGVKGQFEATTSNGSISARLADPEPGKAVKLSSSNGSINLTMDTVRQNDIRASTSNSSITVKLPASAKGQVKAHTSNSSVETDFEIAVQGKISKSHIEGVMNGGGPIIDLTTSNGSIKLLKL